MSPQSLSPSQTQEPLIHRPELAHWNWSSRHATWSQSKHSACHDVWFDVQ